MRRLLFPFCFSFLLLSHYQTTAQNSVGIGTSTPNQYAVLELVSPNGDQGLLVPKLTTSQRTASTFVSGLSSNENGLLVYDSDENQFYYWQDNQWQPINTGGGDADSDPQNEIQDLQLVGSTLTITNNGSATPIDLSGLAGVDAQTLAALKTGSNVDVSISNGNTVVVNVDDNDADPANELQDISLVGSDLSISNGSTIDMSSFLDNTDNQVAGVVPVSPTGNLVSTDVQSSLEELQSEIDLDLDQNPLNEIQNISIAGNTLGIDGGGLGFNLTPLAPSINQVLKWDGARWIAGSDDTGVGTLPALADAQILTNNGSNIAVSVGGDINMNNSGVMTIRPDAVSSSEIVNGTIDNLDISAGANIAASKLESTIMVQGENISLLTNDSGFLTTVSNTDIIDVDPSKISQAGAINGEVLKWNNVGGTWEPSTDLVDDADNDPGNEFQDLSIATDIISLSNSTGTINLVPYLDNTDSQNATAVPVTPSGNLTSADVQAALVELQGDIDTDTDSDPTNEFQDLSIATDIISLSNSAGTINLVPYLDNTDSQNAAAVPVTPSGNLTSVEVQAALEELQADIDLDADTDNTNEFNLGGSLEANNILRVVDAGGNTDIDISRLTGDLDANTNRINNLLDPAAPQDAATRVYVDNSITANTWGITGNSGTTPGTDFVGTTDAQDLVFATNSLSRFRIYDGTGYAALGPLSAGINLGFGANDRFLTISSDANGPGSSGVSSIELSGYSSNLLDEVGRLDFNTRFSGADNLIGRVSVARAGLPNSGEMRFGTHNGTTFNNHVFIDENGNVGIGNSNPFYPLDVTGNLRTTSFQLSTSPTAGYVLTADGIGMGTWQPVPSAFSTANNIPKGNGTGLVGSAIYNDAAGHVGINQIAPTAGLEVNQNDGVLFRGTLGSGTLPATGTGVRMVWYPNKAAIRAGRASGTDWDNANIGNYSVALGFSGIASGEGSASIGYNNTVTGSRSAAFGNANNITNQKSYALGWINDISSQASISIGFDNINSADSAFTIGTWLESSNIASHVIGKGASPGTPLLNNIANSLMIGYNSTAPTLFVGPSFGFASTGNVGIATSSPQQKLDVNGSIKIGSSGGAIAGTMRWTGTEFQGFDGTFWKSFFPLWGESGSNIYYDAGQVSIGNTSPIANYKMEIEVPTASPQAHGLYIDNTYDGGVSYGQWISMDNDAAFNSYGLIVNSVGSTGIDYGVYTFGEDRNYFQGRVGIDDLNPSEALEVNGNITGQSLRDYSDPANNYISWDPGGEIRITGGLTQTLFYGQTDGKVRIGTQFNSGSSRLLVQGFGTGTGEGLHVRNSLGTLNFVVRDNGRVGIRRNPTTYNLEISGDAGKTTGGSDWVIISDKRLKKNVEPFQDGLEELLKVNPVKFRYNELAPTDDTEAQYVGVIAQEIKKILPYMVREMNETAIDESGKEFNVLNYDNSAMTFILINAIKELNEENQTLKEQLQNQNKEIAQIYSLLDQINRKTNVED